MKLSISNLAWQDVSIKDIGPKLSAIGLSGIEMAPTKVWADFPNTSGVDIKNFRSELDSFGLEVSGIQSLLFGHPEFQVFDESSWREFRIHLEKTFKAGGQLGANVAVFGSPRNRICGNLSTEKITSTAIKFFKQLIPLLEDNNIVLTLEPNAPQYGADFLIHYLDVVLLSDQIDSPWIKPQIDTGCLIMVDEDPTRSAEFRLPAHVHVSVPELGLPPSGIDFVPFFSTLRKLEYGKWIVLEMISNKPGEISDAIESARWLAGLGVEQPNV